MNQSIWKATAPDSDFGPLKTDVEVDIAIVGGGITGITSAYLLTQAGKKVVVLEQGQIAGGTTGDATGNLYAMVDKRLHHVQSKWDKNTAGIVAESRTAAMNLVEELVREHNIDCDFKRVPWHLFSEKKSGDKTIEQERRALQDYGLEAEELEELPLPVPAASAIRVSNQAQFNPASFVRGLARVIKPSQCRIYENTPVHKIEKKDRLVLQTPEGAVTAGNVILATHIPKGVYPLHTVLYPHREYALAVRLRSGDYPEGIFWDTDAVNHQSLRSYETDRGKFLLIVGGHHKVGQGEAYEHYYSDLEASVRKYFDVASVDYRWSAQHYKPADGLPFIGESPDEGIFVATGFSTDGLTYGVLSSMILKDLLTGAENSWAETYSASRFTPAKSAKSFLKENLNVAKQYKKNLPGQSGAEIVTDIPRGEGRVVEEDGEKWATFRDEEDRFHQVSAVCTHMKCIVDWNDAEKSWDCPCHGSRFHTNGTVIEGPAYMPLKKKD